MAGAGGRRWLTRERWAAWLQERAAQLQGRRRCAWRARPWLGQPAASFAQNSKRTHFCSASASRPQPSPPRARPFSSVTARGHVSTVTLLLSLTLLPAEPSASAAKKGTGIPLNPQLHWWCRRPVASPRVHLKRTAPHPCTASRRTTTGSRTLNAALSPSFLSLSTHSFPSCHHGEPTAPA